MALLFFKEKVSRKLWIAIGFITLSSIVSSWRADGTLPVVSSSTSFSVTAASVTVSSSSKPNI
nr:hypothetical protein [Streptococcus sanguinis]